LSADIGFKTATWSDAVSTDAPAIRVASVPANHVYVAHLSAPGDEVYRLPDPPPDDPLPLVDQWWPPAMLSVQWINEHHDEFDIFHIQFGFDAQAPADLDAVVDALARHGKPLVDTVHDLRNPHHQHRQAHEAHLDILIGRADALITLTPGAARTIQARWGRRPVVIPHPHVVEFDRMTGPRPVQDGFTIGVHAKSVRASMAPLPVIRTVQEAIKDLPGARLVVDVHHDVFDRNGQRHLPDLADYLRRASERSEIKLHVHDCYTDDELWDYLQGLDVSVLPYKFGTHSGWLEACFDLGTTVVAPDCGYFADQRPCIAYGHSEQGLDGASLRQAVRTAYEQRPMWRADITERRTERAHIAATHRAIYESLLA
jgi:glycosyltransferase involved in cell wall biosynthesis